MGGITIFNMNFLSVKFDAEYDAENGVQLFFVENPDILSLRNILSYPLPWRCQEMFPTSSVWRYFPPKGHIYALKYITVRTSKFKRFALVFQSDFFSSNRVNVFALLL